MVAFCDENIYSKTNVKMVRTKKDGRSSVTIYFNNIGLDDAIVELNNCKVNGSGSIAVDKDSTGFKSRLVTSLRLLRTSNSLIYQQSGELFLELEVEDLDYFLFKLEKSKEENFISPAEILNVSVKGKKGDFYVYGKLT